MVAPTPFENFDPLVRSWFLERVGDPTEIQHVAWPRIAAGEHVLVSAPTGSGKTLTAFLWALDRLLTGGWEPGATRVLYISPLKALNNDIQRNLLFPLAHLREHFAAAGREAPAIDVKTRSGDTPAAERRRIERHPPEILITTPESLNLMLSSLGARTVFRGLQCVILDEIHSVLDSKRGTHLMTAIERLVPLAGEFQRIALSATVDPPEIAAAFIGGYLPSTDPASAPGAARPVSVLCSQMPKRYDVQVCFPANELGSTRNETIWEPLIEQLKRRIHSNRSTLVFVNGRRMCEKVTRLLNADEERLLAYAHHGSLSREIRLEVEERLKRGELKAIVATSSLEMGIDIGSLDEVLMLQSPASISSAIQRAGRAGHGVGQVSRAALFPTASRDLLNAAVLAAEIQARGIERARPVRAPLDVLAQIILSMCATEKRHVDELFQTLRASHPYRELSRELFDLVLKMLAGRYANTRIRDLRPRLSYDAVDGTARTNRSGLAALYLSGGTIPDRGYFQLRRLDGGALIGELDEEFVWEAKVGDRFTLGAQQWRIERITHNDVFVVPAPSKLKDLPFWRAEDVSRGHHFSEKIGELLERADGRLSDAAFRAELRERHALDEAASDVLIGYLKAQCESTGTGLPHRHHLLIERIESGPGGTPGQQMVLHTAWGGRVNRPYALALEAAWEEQHRADLEIYCDNDCIVLQLPGDVCGDDVLALVTSNNYEAHLRSRLEGTGLFGARFREAAGRALLVTRRKFSERLPLWMSRLRSQKLLESVREFDDFPLLLETWRSCLEEEFELHALERMLVELESGVIKVSEVQTSSASPMARSSSFNQVNEYMYRGDQPGADGRSRLRSDLIDQLLFDSQLRPQLPPDLCGRFEDKRRRLVAGYGVRDADELLDWVKERGLVPQGEWKRMLELAGGELSLDRAGAEAILLGPVVDKLCRVEVAGAKEPLVVALEAVNRWVPALYGDQASVVLLSGDPVGVHPHDAGETSESTSLADLLLEWLEFYAPRTLAFVQRTLGVESEPLGEALAELVDAKQLVIGSLLAASDAIGVEPPPTHDTAAPGAAKGDSEATHRHIDAPFDDVDEQLCDARNFEMLLRIARSEAVPNVEPLPVAEFSPFLAYQHGLIVRGSDREGLGDVLDRLSCLPLPARLWESDILAARVDSYRPEWLDAILRESELMWLGAGARSIGFVFKSDLDLWGQESESSAAADPRAADGAKAEGDLEGDPGAAEGTGSDLMTIDSLFRDPLSRYDFATLQSSTGLPAMRVERLLWEGAFSGLLTSDGFEALRSGIVHNFEPVATSPTSGRAAMQTDARAVRPSGRTPGRRPIGGRHRFARWKSRSAVPGSFELVHHPTAGDERLEREERNRERARLLLDRHGVLFRELLQREAPPFQWRRLFSSLRLMELSGEIVSGSFFEGIQGLQFMSHAALRNLLSRPWQGSIFWLNAVDPASPCGLKLQGVLEPLPRRVSSTHLTFHGARLVLVSQRNGRELDFRVPPETPELPQYFGVLRHLMSRPSGRVKPLLIERVNGVPAPGSPYLDALRVGFDLFVEPKLVGISS